MLRKLEDVLSSGLNNLGSRALGLVTNGYNNDLYNEYLMSHSLSRTPVDYKDFVDEGYAYVRGKTLFADKAVYIIRRIEHQEKDYYRVLGPVIVISIPDNQAKNLGLQNGVVYLNDSLYRPVDSKQRDLAIVDSEEFIKIKGGLIVGYLTNGLNDKYKPESILDAIKGKFTTRSHYKLHYSIGFGNYGFVPQKVVDGITESRFPRVNPGETVPVVLYNNGKPEYQFPAIVSRSGERIQVPYNLVPNDDLNAFDDIGIFVGMKSDLARKLL